MAKIEEKSIVEVVATLKETFNFLWTKKIPILIVSILGGVVGFLYAYLKPIEYEAKLTFIVEESESSNKLGALSGLASSFGMGGFGGGGLYTNQANLLSYLKSRTVIEECYLSKIPGTDVTFAEKFLDEYNWRKHWEGDSVLSRVSFQTDKINSQFSPEEDSILFVIFKTTIEDELLRVDIPDEGSILSIRFKSRSNILSRYFPETLLSIVSKNYTETKTKLVRENVELLQYQTDSVKNALNESLLIAANSTDKVFGLNPALNVRRVPANKEQIDIQASTAMLEQLIKNLELAKVQLKDNTPLIETIDLPKYPLELIKVSKKSSAISVAVLLGILYSLFLISVRFVKTNINRNY